MKTLWMNESVCREIEALIDDIAKRKWRREQPHERFAALTQCAECDHPTGHHRARGCDWPECPCGESPTIDLALVTTGGVFTDREEAA